MFLYSTILLIKDKPVRYEVSTQQNSTYLIYKPERFFRRSANLPSFWITRQHGKWEPLNIKDTQLRLQVVNDISVNYME